MSLAKIIKDMGSLTLEVARNPRNLGFLLTAALLNFTVDTANLKNQGYIGQRPQTNKVVVEENIATLLKEDPFTEQTFSKYINDWGGNIDYARKILTGTRDTKGKKIETWSGLARLCRCNADLDYVRNMLDLLNRNLDALRDEPRIGHLIGSYKESNVSVEFARQLLELRNQKGKRVFKCGKLLKRNDIPILARKGVPIEYIRKTYKHLPQDHNLAYTIARAHQLGIQPEDLMDFKDNGKPNCLITYPTDDFNQAFETAISLQIYKEIKKHYNVKVVFTGDEKQIYKEIEAMPDIKLLILSGHGTRFGMKIADKEVSTVTLVYDSKVEREVYVETLSDEHGLSIEDKELEKYLSRLPEDAVIFLSSCSNAKPVEGADDNELNMELIHSLGDRSKLKPSDVKENFAEFIARIAKGRTVYASKTDFSLNQIKIGSYIPFKITIKNAANTFCSK